jgi:hypothetical protein
MLRVLDKLLNVNGERLSYRTLDVEQIGSVYETVMGFTVETRTGPALALRAGKNNKTPVFVDVAALSATKGSDRAKFLKQKADRNSLPDKIGKALTAATDPAGVIAALRDIVDERGSPGGDVAAPGTPLLQPTHERRRTGSHYTPRTLTEPIVKHALEPAFARIGENARPDAVLDLKVCDPAMGSGAFLVEACRLIATRLVKAWEKHKDARPDVPPDEDEYLHARRLVAQRCIYGVDKNPRAVDLARLSLWLVTLARDHEFTFLDHALKCGDSLVGLTLQQIEATHWDTSKPPTFVGKLVKDHLKEAEEGRARIRDHADGATEAELRPLLKAVDAKLEVARLIGDGVVSAFFHSEKAKERIKRLVEFQNVVHNHLGSRDWVDAVAPFGATLKIGEHPIRAFHWLLEFPEVFSRKNGGFDAIVGNPPFAGKNTIIAGHRKNYLVWLQTLHQNAHGNADLVAHFFRRAFGLLRLGGVLGLIATNTIGQGDTRDSGLTQILAQGGEILQAKRRLKWPGEAAVVVSVVHITKGAAPTPILDGHVVKRISAYLVEGALDCSPKRLASNLKRAFKGSELQGFGFVFSPNPAGAESPIGDVDALLTANPDCRSRIRHLINGDDLVNDIHHTSERMAFNISDLSYDDAGARFSDLLELAKRRVKPERDRLGSGADARRRRENWWKWSRYTPALYLAMANSCAVIGTAYTSPHMNFCFVDRDAYYLNTAVLITKANMALFASLQSRTHEVWARFFASSMKDDLRYAPSDCFETFPFSKNIDSSHELELAGQTYHDHRAALVVSRKDGMTKIYNRFHNCRDTVEDIRRLRELHAAMDYAVLEAYGWHDLAACATAAFLDETNEDDHPYQGRLFWPSELRHKVLARLLALNAERAADERAAGVATVSDVDEEEDETDEEVDA